MRRRNEHGELVYAVVHKREYGEWCLPKGKLRPDESWEGAGIREVEEETGAVSTTLGPTAINGYRVKGIPKIVVFFAMETSATPVFTPSQEIDRVEWLHETEVRRRLSHGGERRAFDEIVQATESL